MLMLAKTAMLRSQRAAAASPLAFVSASSNGRTASTSAIVVTAPSSITNGNTLYAFVVQYATGATAATISGFSQVGSNLSVTGATVTILKKTAASESGDYTVNATDSTIATAVILNYSGGAGTEDVVGALTRHGNATSTGASITPTTAGTLLFFAAQAGSSRTISTPPSGMTQRHSLQTGSTPAVAVYDLAQAASSTGAKNLVWNTGTNDAGVLMQIK